jgi:hypothetical protein
MEASSEPLMPRSFALLILGSGDLRPRKRARDQQADRAGLDLKRRMLDRLVEIDPEPQELDAALLRIVGEMGPPTGPTRAIAESIREDWQAACLSPEWVGLLLSEALQERHEKKINDPKVHP